MFKILREKQTGVLCDLLRKSLDRDPVTPDLVRQLIWEDPRQEDGLTLAIEAEGRLMGVAVTVVGPVVGRATLKLLAVDVAHQGQGIGSRLLAETERRLRDRAEVVRLGESAPIYWWPGVPVDKAPALEFFARRGYRTIGQARNMVVDLASLTAPGVLPERLEIVRASPDQRKDLMTFLARHWPAWQDEIAAGFRNDPITVFLGFDTGVLAGFAAYDCNRRGTGWFGPMGTAAEHRGSGLGRHLLYACLLELARQGHATATIPWVDPVRFYERAANARVDRLFARFEKSLSRG